MLLVSLVTVPTGILLLMGVLMLVFYKARLNLVFGVLVLALAVCLVTGAVLAMVFIRREARLSRLQSDFVSKVSHELRTPLTSIRLFVETLQEGRVSPEDQAACIQALGDETGRLTRRIERLLDWGRMEAGKRIYEPQADTVASVVQSALDAWKAAMAGRPAEVAVDLPPELPPIEVDRGAMVDALVNLLSNADKYGHGEITVSATADDRWVRLSVTDNGVGIPRAEHRRIFQKFYRVDERLSRAAEGTGLGLSIVQHVARAHGGRVEVESAPGEGATFTILIPHDVAPEQDPEAAHAPA